MHSLILLGGKCHLSSNKSFLLPNDCWNEGSLAFALDCLEIIIQNTGKMSYCVCIIYVQEAVNKVSEERNWNWKSSLAFGAQRCVLASFSGCWQQRSCLSGMSFNIKNDLVSTWVGDFSLTSVLLWQQWWWLAYFLNQLQLDAKGVCRLHVAGNTIFKSYLKLKM